MTAEQQLAGLTLTQAADLLYAAAEALSRAAHGDGTTDLEPAHALLVLDRIRDANWLIGTVDAGLVSHVYEHGPRGKQIIDGIGQVDVGRTQTRKRWDERGALRDVVDARMEERGGLLPNDPYEVIEWLLEFAGVSYLRVEPLRALGLDPDDYSTRERGNVKVQLPTHRR